MVKSITESSSHEHAAGVAGHEYAAMSGLRSRLNGEMRASIPQPLLWVPGTPTFAMSKLDGVTLHALLRRQASAVSLWGRRSIVATAGRIGDWLREFHAGTVQPAVGFEPAGFLGDLDRHVQRATANGWSRDRADEVSARARTAAIRATGWVVRCASRQGDFSVQNILLDDGRVRVVDFENFGETDAIYEDICAFTSYLRLLSSSPVYSRSTLEAMRRTFVHAYGVAIDDPLFALYELKLAVAVLSEFRPGARRLKRRRHQALQRHVCTMAERLGSDLDFLPGSAGDRAR